jgi:alpha-mannosidase
MMHFRKKATVVNTPAPKSKNATQDEHDILVTIIPMQDQKPNIDDILSNKTRLVVLMQATHLDWNWVGSNLQYYREGVPDWNKNAGSVRNILDSATAMVTETLENPIGSQAAYSLAEIGFLKQYLERKPGKLAELRAAGQLFSLIGGAIETPDDILPHGEAFIRAYLQTRIWSENTLPESLSRFAYLPDDFGHTPCLPATFEAMGIAGFGFARCPGSDVAQNNGTAGPLLVKNRNVDFLWKTDDGSETLAHYLQWGYNQGNQKLPQSPASEGGIHSNDDLRQVLFDARTTPAGVDPATTPGGGNALTVRAPYCMVPFGEDFAMPELEVAGQGHTSRLFSIAKDWNTQSSADRQNTYAVVATFDQYMRLVAAWSARNPKDGLQSLQSPSAAGASTATFWGTPYWTGFYASQPELKRLHQGATRALLAAESLAAIAGLAPAVYGTQMGQGFLDTAWQTVGISASHNLLTGCGPNKTTYAETQPFFRYAQSNASALRQSHLESIAAAIKPVGGPDKEVVLFNELGVKRTTGRVAVYTPDPTAAPNLDDVRSVISIDKTRNFPARPASDGSLHIMADVDPLGYQQFSLSADDVALSTMGCTVVTRSTNDTSITIQNGLLSAEVKIGKTAADMLVTVTGPNSKPIQHGLKVLHDDGESSNHSDAGGIFRFGPEYGQPFGEDKVDNAWQATVTPTTSQVTDLMIVQRFQVQLTSATVELELELCSGDPYVKVSVTGALKPFDSLMASFNFNDAISDVTHGTPHGTSNVLPPMPPQNGQNCAQGKAPRTWIGPYFIPTHDFIVFQDGTGDAMGAVYHTAVHAWSVRLKDQPADQAIPAKSEALACLLRNAQGGGWEGASASDNGTHTVEYAIRVADDLPMDPTNKALPKIQLLAESRATAWPIAAVTPLTSIMQDGPDSSDVYVRHFKDNFSLASVDGDAVINVAKIGSRKPVIDDLVRHTDESLILRIFTYSPGKELTVRVPDTAALPSPSTSDGFLVSELKACGLNALEEDLSDDRNKALAIKVDLKTSTFTFTPTRGLTTLRVDRTWTGIPDSQG